MRHSALVLNIGTFAEEDEAYELLENLSLSLPFTIMFTSVLDAMLVAVYLNWLHPWRIILQEVSLFNLCFYCLVLVFYPRLGTRLMGS